MERQTRDEDVCILVRGDGQFHLERIALGVSKTRVYEGSFPPASVSEIEQMLNADQLKQLAQSQIAMALVSEDVDRLLIAIRRLAEWQSLNFPSGKSRKPFRDSIDPLVKWLDRAKQQPQALPPGTATNRCMPPPEPEPQTNVAGAGSAAGAQASGTNPYLMRIVEDHMMAETTKVATANRPQWDQNVDVKVERVCVIVYQTGRYRMEKSKQEYNAAMRSDVYLDSISDGQVQELRQVLNDPELVKLERQVTGVALRIKEGETVDVAIPRGAATQKLSFASYFGMHSQELGLRDNLHTGVDADAPVIKPLRKWLKTNIVDKKVPISKDVPSTSCIPSQKPE